VKFTVGYPPALNQHWRVFRNRILVSAESRAYKCVAALQARTQGARPLAGPCRLEVHLYRPRRAGDLDGRLKVLLDCLNGIAWEDDSQVVEIHAFRHEDKVNPRAEVEVSPA
jgi:crossover junction endodeoxyribonuclease RusA